ncbi:2-acylglycerol O-acyltransferase 1 [Larimichthys crocea]|nr:2-acylglycerol O-acyltransferase 1 [Larimichthys crocea]
MVALLYAGWLWLDWDTPSSGGRRSQWVRSWTVWDHFRDYFPIRLVKTVDLDPKKNYIFGFHPHVVLKEVMSLSSRSVELQRLWTLDQNRLQSIMGVAMPLFHARGVFQYSFGLMPYRKPIQTVGLMELMEDVAFDCSETTGGLQARTDMTERLDGLNPERLDGLNPERLDGLNPERLDGLNPERLDGPNPERLDGPNPERLDGPNPERLDGPNPERLDGPNPERLDGLSKLR